MNLIYFKNLIELEKVNVVPTKNPRQRCTLIIFADGFEEADTVGLLSALRQAGICVKSVGLTLRLVNGSHGIGVMPDLALAGLPAFLKQYQISYLFLADGRQSLVRLVVDPRIRRILQQVIAQRGQIVLRPEGMSVLRSISIWHDDAILTGDDGDDEPSIRLWARAESAKAIAEDLIRQERTFDPGKPTMP